MSVEWTYPVLNGADGKPVVVGIRDGDTVALLLNGGCYTGLFPWLRVADIDCPELRARGGPEAAAFTAYQLANAEHIRVTVRGRSFDRWISDIIVDGDSLADLLVDAGYARRV